MSDEEIEQIVVLGKMASAIYRGALDNCNNTKIAEKITFIYFSAVLYGRDDSVTMILDLFKDGGNNQ